MFHFVQWDSPLMLVGELALSATVVAAIMFVARIVNSGSQPPSTSPRDSNSDNDEQ